jgi:AcrR family transcriptional regulator
MPARRGNAGDPTTRNALLDAAQHVMTTDGYAAATARRVAAEAGVNSALVFYYFESLDGMFVALFRRGAEGSFERLQHALASPQPLWSFWELIHDRSNSAMTMEFIALANHRKAIRKEIADYSRRFRRAQLDALSDVLAGHGGPEAHPEHWPAPVVVLLLSSISRYLLTKTSSEASKASAVPARDPRRPERPLPGRRRRWFNQSMNMARRGTYRPHRRGGTR